jgi:uncharacterized repeat protein (TIGR01451 family)
MIVRFFAAALLLVATPAFSQTPGALNWSGLGLADEDGIPTGSTQTSAGVGMTVTWSTVTDGGSFIAASGLDFVSYDSGTQGGVTGYAQMGFDNSRQDADDKVTLNVAFNEAVQNVQFTIVDVDQASWDDFIEVYYNTGSGFVNARSGSFTTSVGPSAGIDDESFGVGWEGVANADPTTTDGNVVFSFGSQKITAIRIVYFSGNDAGGGGFDPVAQQLGVSNIAFTKLAPLISVVKSVANATAGTFNIPGEDVIYTITVTNSGDGAVDSDEVFLADHMPAELAFFNGDFDGAGPETNAVGFSQSGAGLTFSVASDLRYSNAISSPASFSDCNYSPASGYDPNVRHICLNPKGAMNAGSPTATSFSVQFRGRIE